MGSEAIVVEKLRDKLVVEGVTDELLALYKREVALHPGWSLLGADYRLVLSQG